MSAPARGQRSATRGRDAPQNQLQALDALRFVAALAVVIYHFRRFLSEEVAGALSAAAHFHYAVDLFFVISGYVIAHVYSDRLASLADYGTFLRRRVARLVPLHWLTLSVYVCIGLLLLAGLGTTAHEDNYDWGCLLPNALAIHSFGVCDGLSFNFVSWSVSAEMGMYALAPLALALGRRSPWALVTLAAASAAALTLVTAQPGLAPFLPERAWSLWTFDFGVLRALPAFLLGVGLHFFRDRIARIPFAAWSMCAAVVAFVLVATYAPSPLMLVALAYLIALLGAAADAQGRPGRPAALLAPAGGLTYGVYMLHPLVLTVLLTLIGERMLSLTGAPMDLLVLLAVLVTLGAAMVSFRWVEIPARRWISGSRVRRTT